MSAPAGPGPWAAVYAGYDDAALATLATAGLVRRGRKDVAAGRVEVIELRADGVTLSVGGAHVELDARGPAAARCACPTPGACQHVVAACLWAREAADDSAVLDDGAVPDDATVPAGAVVPGDAAESAGPGAPAGADPLSEILALDPRSVHRAAGAAVVRAVAQEVREPSAGTSAEPARTSTDVTVDGPRALVSWPGAPRVTYVAGAGFAGMLVDREQPGGTPSTGRADDRRWRLEALARVWLAHGRAWPWPQETATAPRPSGVPDAGTVADEVVRAVERVLDVGLSHLGHDDLEELRGAGVLARLGRRPAVQRLTTSALGRLEALADRADGVDEEDCLLALAELWAFVQAEPAPDAAAPDEHVADLERLVPVGARWWVAASGARGVTVHLWDAVEGRTRAVTTGRPPGADPTFRRSWHLPLVWGRSVEALCRGPFALRGATERAGAGLRPGEGPVVTPLGTLDAATVRDVAERTAAAPARTEVGFGRRPAVVRVVMVRDAGPVGVDEVAQRLTWTLVAADGSPVVVRVDAADEPACDVLLGVAAGSGRLVAVAVEHDLGTDGVEAVGLFVEHPGGGLRLVVPTLTPADDQRAASTSWTRLRARVRALRGRAVTQVREAPVPSPVEDVCATVLDVVVALAATGRRRPSPHQAAALARAARTADDLGATTLAAAATLPDAGPDAAALLRAAFVASRGRALARSLAAAPAGG
ncbi:hypothetical protein ACH436_14880 [Isoptericola sp. NPDC019693]|uniref:hypothetical protein n=1 Tax=Isoptericola sp. NPDC019693 TaxID=3364009 RepID=UPI0037B2F4DA